MKPILRTQLAEIRENGKTFCFNQTQLDDLMDLCTFEGLLVDYKKGHNGIEEHLIGFIVYQLGGEE